MLRGPFFLSCLWHFCCTCPYNMYEYVYVRIRGGVYMKRNRLLSKITLGVACLLGVGGAITAGTVLSNRGEEIHEARADTKNVVTLEKLNIISNTGFTSCTKNGVTFTGDGKMIYDNDNKSVNIGRGQESTITVSENDLNSKSISHMSLSINHPSNIPSVTVTVNRGLINKYTSTIYGAINPFDTGSIAIDGYNELVITFTVGTDDSHDFRMTNFNLTLYTSNDKEVYIEPTSGCVGGYVSTDQNATSGNQTDYFFSGDVVYGFVEMKDGYFAPTEWTNISGNIYRIAETITVEISEMGFYHVGPESTINLINWDNQEISTFRAQEGKVLRSLEDSEIPTREGFAFAGFYSTKSGSGTQYYDENGDSVYPYNNTSYGWSSNSQPITNMYARFTRDMTVSFPDVTVTYDGQPHSTIATVSDPATGATIRYGTSQSSCTLVDPIQKTNVGNYTIYVEITADNYTTYQGSAKLKINKAPTHVDPVPTSITGLKYTGEYQALINNDGHTDFGELKYAVNTVLEVPESSEFSTTIPTRRDVGTYYVFYKSTGDSNHAEYPASVENAIEVRIDEVDKSALAALIDEVDDFIDSIGGKYQDIISNLNAVKTYVKTAGIDNPNVTVGEVDYYVEVLQAALSSAKIDIAEAKINAIGEVEYTPECIALINDVRDFYYNELTTQEQEAVDPDLVAILESDLLIYDHVDNAVKHVNDLDPKNTKEYRDAVKEASDLYDGLTASEKEIYPSDVKKELDDHLAILSVIDMIDELKPYEYSTEYKAKLDAARSAYEALTDDQKELVKKINYSDLTHAESVYSRVGEAYDKINDIGEVEYTETCKAKIDEARATYDALTDEEKSLVDASTLTILAVDEKIYDAFDKIHTIGDVEYTEACKAKIDTARTAYDALTDAEKKQIDADTLNILITDEKIYDVLSKINTIGNVEYTDACKAKIDAARSTYDALTAEEKNLVGANNLQTLTDAEKVYEALGKINAIGEVTYNDESKALIEEARQYYDDLTDDQKEQVGEEALQVLADAENVYESLKKIDSIGEVKATKESKALIDDAREYYDSLTDKQKEQVGDAALKILVDDEHVYNSLAKIDAIGKVEATKASYDKITDARNYYNSLTQDQKDQVGSEALKVLVDAEHVYELLSKIKGIGEISHTSECLKKITDARSYYDSLTDKQKEQVGKEALQELVDAEKVYQALVRIDAIGDVEYSDESKELIEEARSYYNSLTPEQKAKVSGTELEVLTQSEEKFESLKTGGNAVSIVFLIISILAFLAGCFFLYKQIRNRRKDNNDQGPKGGSGKKGEVKAMSVSILVPTIFASFYGQGAFVALYIFIALAVAVWIANLVLFILRNPKPKDMSVWEYCKYLAKKLFTKQKEEVKPIEKVEEPIPSNEEESSDEEVITVTDSKGNIFQIRFIKSFTAKIIQANDDSKKYYEELKNYVLSYKGTTSRVSWNYDSINSGRNPVVKFGVRGKTLCLYYPLDADKYADTKYKVEKVESKKYGSVPCMYRIKNDRRFGYAKDLIDEVANALGLVKGGEKRESYVLPYEENKPLVARGLIKELKVQVNKPAEVVLDKKVNAEGDEIVTTRDSNGNIFEIRFIKSFLAKLSQSSDEVKADYNELKNYVLGYKKANSRISWHFDSINVGKNQALKFSIRGKTLCLYYALDSEKLDPKYKVEKAEAKKYEAVPTLYRIKNERRFNYAKELIDLLMSSLNVEKGKESNEDFRVPYETTEALLAKGLIKEVKTKVNNASEVHESISVQEADSKMSDEVAEASIKEDTSGRRHKGRKAIINIDTIGNNYKDNDEVTIESLIEKKLVPSDTGYVKVLARGSLDKKLHVDLQDYSIQAVKMILLEGGTVKKAK